MNRNLLLIIISIGIFTIVQTVSTISISLNDDLNIDLKEEQKVINQKYITAKLLSNSLYRVYNLFDVNLSKNKKDRINKSANIDFLNYLTDQLDKFKIESIYLEPKESKKIGKNIINPYEIEIITNYKKLGKFLTALEKADRLIEIEKIHLKNGLERVRSTNKESSLENQNIRLTISSITLSKDRSNG